MNLSENFPDRFSCQEVRDRFAEYLRDKTSGTREILDARQGGLPFNVLIARYHFSDP